MAMTLVVATLVLGLANWAIGLLVAVFVIISLVLVLAVLIQKPQGGGLSGAFGAGGGSGQTAFGTKTGDVLTMTTISIFVLWLVFAVVLNFATRPVRPESGPGVIQSSGVPSESPGGTPTGAPTGVAVEPPAESARPGAGDGSAGGATGEGADEGDSSGGDGAVGGGG